MNQPSVPIFLSRGPREHEQMDEMEMLTLFSSPFLTSAGLSHINSIKQALVQCSLQLCAVLGRVQDPSMKYRGSFWPGSGTRTSAAAMSKESHVPQKSNKLPLTLPGQPTQK